MLLLALQPQDTCFYSLQNSELEGWENKHNAIQKKKKTQKTIIIFRKPLDSNPFLSVSAIVSGSVGLCL